MNRDQINLITQLQSGINVVREKTIEDLTKNFDEAMNKVVEVSNDPKEDGEENLRKFDELKEEFKKELNEVFEKFDKKLNSL